MNDGQLIGKVWEMLNYLLCLLFPDISVDIRLNFQKSSNFKLHDGAFILFSVIFPIYIESMNQQIPI